MGHLEVPTSKRPWWDKFSISTCRQTTKNGPSAGESFPPLKLVAAPSSFIAGVAGHFNPDDAQQSGRGLQLLGSWSDRVEDEQGSQHCNGPHQ